MTEPVLILPGYHGSGPNHWQSWLQTRLPQARRLQGVDWERPVLDAWVECAKTAIREQGQPLWLVAHSFGCLTAVTAASQLLGRVAGALLVAPADPERFTAQGARDRVRTPNASSLASKVPAARLPFPTLIVASSNDPWMKMDTVHHWADAWGSAVVEIGAAGHINIDSGFGPWQAGLELLGGLQTGRLAGPSAVNRHPFPTAPARSSRRTEPLTSAPSATRSIASSTLRRGTMISSSGTL